MLLLPPVAHPVVDHLKAFVLVQVRAFRTRANELANNKQVRRDLEEELESLYLEATDLFDEKDLYFPPDSQPASTAAEEGLTVERMLDMGWWPLPVR